MKKLLIILALISLSGLYSCKKCTTCRIVTDQYTSFPEKFCGSSKEVRDFKANYDDQAAALPYSYSRAECTDDN
jgi:hypothetical protein